MTDTPSRETYGPALSDTDFGAFVHELLAKKYPGIYGWTVHKDQKLPDSSTVDFYVARKDPHGMLIESLVVNARRETVTLADVDRAAACRVMQKAGRSMIFVPKKAEVPATVRDYAMKSGVRILPFNWHPSVPPKKPWEPQSPSGLETERPPQETEARTLVPRASDEKNTRMLDELLKKLKAADERVQDMCNVVYGASLISPPPQILNLITDALITQISSVLNFVRIVRGDLLPVLETSSGAKQHYAQIAESLGDIEVRATRQLDSVTNTVVDPNKQFVAIGEAHALTIDSLDALSHLMPPEKSPPERSS